MNYLGVLGLWLGVFLPSTSFANLQCTNIFTKSEDTIAAPTVLILSPELQSILDNNIHAVREFQKTDTLLLNAKSYEEITFAIKNKVSRANALIDVVIQNIIFLKYNSTPQFFQMQLSKISADSLNRVAETFRIPDSQLNTMIHTRLENQIQDMIRAQENFEARQSYMGFREPTPTTGPETKTTIGFGPRKSITEDTVAAPKATEETPVKKAPMGFIHFAERNSEPSLPSEMGFVPRKEGPNNIPRFILVIDGKTGLIDAINPDAKIGF